VTDPDRRSSSERASWASGRGRALAIAGGVLAIVLVAGGVAFVLGGGLHGTTLPPASIPAGVVATPAPTAEPTPGPTGTASPTPGAQTTPGASGAPTATPAATVGPKPTPTPTGGEKVAIRAKRIRIARLGIDLPIIEGDGIDAPIGKAAHFPSTGWPDGGTNIYIYGHARKGMFITLWDARRGDTVVLDLVDGTSRTYVVTKVLPTVPWDAIGYLDPTPTEQLTLQTSTSYYPTAPRFVVIAVPQP
jgi:LPXTG-site transpeptidase (sortase) family protein